MAEENELERYDLVVAVFVLLLSLGIGLGSLSLGRAPIALAVGATISPHSPFKSSSLFERPAKNTGVVTRLIQTDRLMNAADVNADGAIDLIALTEERDETKPKPKKGAPRPLRYLAFDGKTGELLWRAEELGSIHSAHSLVKGGHLLVVDSKGRLVSYDVRSGVKEWEANLPSSVTEFCKTKEPGVIRVSTSDKPARINLETGQLAEGEKGAAAPKTEACQALRSQAPPPQEMEDRVDHRAPPGMTAVVCGKVTSGDTVLTPDPCAPLAQIDFKGLDGIQADSLWQLDGEFLMLGFSKDGSRTPMLGLVRDGAVVWKSEVRDDSKIDADSGPPERVFLDSGLLYLSYGSDSSHPTFATAFEIGSGARLWNAMLPITGKVESIVVDQGVVFIGIEHVVVGLSAADGKALFTAGDSE